MDKLRGNASSLHVNALKIVKEIFPHYGIQNESPIKVRNQTLYLDILIKELNIAIETDGDQHKSFNKFFHGTIAGFLKAKQNDQMKEDYCKDKHIVLVRLNKTELNKETVMLKIKQALKEKSNDRAD